MQMTSCLPINCIKSGSQSTSASIYEAIERVEVLDPSTVTIHFTEVNPAWYLPFIGIQGAILPRHVFEPYNGDNAQNAPANTLPVGTGPYRPIAPALNPRRYYC